MLIGQATLKSPAFDPRLTMLIAELRELGCTVWLKGLSVHFDVTFGAEGDVDARAFRTQQEALVRVFERYDDVIVWGFEPIYELIALEQPAPVAAQRKAPLYARWRWFAPPEGEPRTPWQD